MRVFIPGQGFKTVACGRPATMSIVPPEFAESIRKAIDADFQKSLHEPQLPDRGPTRPPEVVPPSVS